MTWRSCMFYQIALIASIHISNMTFYDNICHSYLDHMHTTCHYMRNHANTHFTPVGANTTGSSYVNSSWTCSTCKDTWILSSGKTVPARSRLMVHRVKLSQCYRSPEAVIAVPHLQQSMQPFQDHSKRSGRTTFCPKLHFKKLKFDNLHTLQDLGGTIKHYYVNLHTYVIIFQRLKQDWIIPST